MKILVVDDEPVVAALIAEALGMQGHDAVVAHDGQTALELIESAAPDAVFLDLVMPGLTGIEVLARIRQTHQTLPVIVFSGRATADMVVEVKRLGATDVLEKPIALARLGEALGRLKEDR